METVNMSSVNDNKWSLFLAKVTDSNLPHTHMRRHAHTHTRTEQRNAFKTALIYKSFRTMIWNASVNYGHLLSQGQFCESCAPGFTRLNPGAGLFSPCVRCFCNNHQQDGSSCDPDTGACNCTHNTTGINCQLCLNGFFGYPASGRPGRLPRVIYFEF